MMFLMRRLRRNTPTINALKERSCGHFGRLVDCQFFRLIASLGRPEFDALGEATRGFAARRNIQLVKRGDDELSVEEYLDIVSGKKRSPSGCLCSTWGASEQKCGSVAGAGDIRKSSWYCFSNQDDILDTDSSSEKIGSAGRDAALEAHIARNFWLGIHLDRNCP